MNAEEEIRRAARTRYDRLAAGYVQSPGHAAGEDLERLVAFAAPAPEWTVVDVATGGGHTALRLAPHVRLVIAVDLAPRMLSAARRHAAGHAGAPILFVCAAAGALPLATAQVDLVTCRIAPHHFPDVAAFVREAARLLRPGGRLVVQDHLLPDDGTAAREVDDFERLRDPSHHRAFNRAEWRAYLEAAALTVEQEAEIVKRHPFLDWAARQAATPGTLGRLQQRMDALSPVARDWLAPAAWGTAEASFANHHLLIAARREAS